MKLLWVDEEGCEHIDMTVLAERLAEIERRLAEIEGHIEATIGPV